MKRRRAKAKSSMLVKLLLPMVALLLFQSVMIGGTIIGSGSIRRLGENACDILNERVIGRRNYLNNDMIQRWSNFSGLQAEIGRKVWDFLGENGLTVRQLSVRPTESGDLLCESAPSIAQLLRGTGATGAFLILDAESTSTRHNLQRPGIYLRDFDPLSNPNDYSDLLLERGPARVGKALGVPIDASWNVGFNFISGDVGQFPGYCGDYFTRPMAAARAHPTADYQDLGYWSKPFRLSANDIEIITYSVPLMNRDGVICGVIGVEISLDYLRRMLPYDELSTGQKGGYLLGVDIDATSGLLVEPVLGSGPMLKSVIRPQTNLRMMPSDYDGMEQVTRGNYGGEIVYGAVQKLSLYNSNTPFEEEEWVLIGMMREADLLSVAHKMRSQLLGAVVTSVLVGILLVGVAARIVTRPITALAEKVRTSDPDNPVTLDSIGIDEIDELSGAIESLGRSVAESASRMSKIVALTNMPIAAFELRPQTESVYCTDTMFELLDFGALSLGRKTVPKDVFLRVLEQAKRCPEPGNDSVYCMAAAGESLRWLKIQTIEDGGRILGIVMDVTAETLERHRIEHERDYDTLTLLLNRRAFVRQVRPLFDCPQNLKVAAFVMWDLDNLKFINDTYGHDLGDEYIRKAAAVLKEFTGYGGIAARMSGDEFYVFLGGFSDKDGIRAAIADIRSRLDATLLLLPDGTSLRIRASAGVSWYPDDSTDYESLVRYADFAMYEVKNTIKGDISEFDWKSYERDAFLLHSREELNRLIDNSLVRYAFQPIIETATGKIFAYEALMRPQMETLRSPLDVVRLARSQSKLYQIEKLTWRMALAAYAQYQEQMGEAKLFLNSIPNNLLDEGDICRIEALYGSLLHNLVVELTENEQADEQISKLKRNLVNRWGAQLALDDFGSGYSNDLVLLSLQPDYVKLDMSIVRGIDSDPDRRKLVQNLISYTRERNIKVIAEGVETIAEMETLVRFHVDYIQGYLFGKPQFEPALEVPEQALAALLDCNRAMQIG